MYIGDYFEWTGSTSTMKKCYYAAGRRVALRVGSETPLLLLLLSDHLGSTSVTANILTGAKIADAHYKPFGENWYESTPPMQTSYRYTGQRLEADLGLYDYGARFYDPALGRFIQADTIVPPESKRVAVTPLQVGAFEPEYVAQIGQENREVAAYGYSFQRDAQTLSRTRLQTGPVNPQLLNRYGYVLGNPTKYVDPDGHVELTYEQARAILAFLNDLLARLALFGSAETITFGALIGLASGSVQWAFIAAAIGQFWPMPVGVLINDLTRLRDALAAALDVAAYILAVGEHPVVHMHATFVGYFAQIMFTVYSREQHMAISQRYASCTDTRCISWYFWALSDVTFGYSSGYIDPDVAVWFLDLLSQPPWHIDAWRPDPILIYPGHIKQ